MLLRELVSIGNGSALMNETGYSMLGLYHVKVLFYRY